MEDSFYPHILDILHGTIREAGGNEVFFRGRTDDVLRVAEVDVLARGSADAVPAILQDLRYGDVVIHNHPSGILQPSQPDLEIASRLGAMGVGFFIINNAADAVYRVVEPFRPKEHVLLEPEEIARILGAGGSIAEALPGYEDRPEQLRMALTCGEAFNQDQLASIEAGTGTGKSLAYLVPAILWAQAHEERVVISTNTINLQEQLIRKDIPFLQRTLGIGFRAVLVKGRSNYVCKRKLETAGSEPGLFDGENRGELAAIREWTESTGDGSREDLSFVPKSEVWEEVCCEADQCSRTKCPHYNNCFLFKARRLAAQADLLVVNHALLLTDLVVRQQTENYSSTAVLPPYNRLVLDEAHHLEDVATSHFTGRTTRYGFARVLNRLRHPRKVDQGLLPRLLRDIGKELPDSFDTLYRDLHERIEFLLSNRQALLDQAVRTLEQAGEDLAGACGMQVEPGREARQRILEPLRKTAAWQETATRLKDLAADTSAMASGVKSLLKKCEEMPESVQDKLASPLVDLQGIIGRLELLSDTLLHFLHGGEDACVWFEASFRRVGRGQSLVTHLCNAPLEVAESLHRSLYARFKTVILTSATLTVDRKFDYFTQRVGLNHAEPGRLNTLLLASPFDYEKQALLAIPTDVPEPNRPGYAEAVRDLTEEALRLSGGRSFVLFTAYSLLSRIHGELAPVLQATGLPCLKQGEDARHRLLKQFAAEEASILFGTDSFWEGVDVPGRALEQVVIARLPFKVPTEPVQEARAEAIERRGGNPFMEMTVPQAVLKFKQGFGRLIRNRTDRGVVLILDSRVVSKRYGKLFLRSLPEARQVISGRGRVMTDIRQFFAQEENPVE